MHLKWYTIKYCFYRWRYPTSQWQNHQRSRDAADGHRGVGGVRRVQNTAVKRRHPGNRELPPQSWKSCQGSFFLQKGCCCQLHKSIFDPLVFFPTPFLLAVFCTCHVRLWPRQRQSVTVSRYRPVFQTRWHSWGEQSSHFISMLKRVSSMLCAKKSVADLLVLGGVYGRNCRGFALRIKSCLLLEARKRQDKKTHNRAKRP